jgi:hypothetical protein
MAEAASLLTTNMQSLHISDSAKLDTLPADILLLILGYLDTARSVAHLAATCRGLHQFVSANGWREFVTTCFRSLKLPTVTSNKDWVELARALTSQTRDWDRRAFIFHSLSPPVPRQRNGRRIRTGQSIPVNILVDAHENRDGSLVEELVLWGAGEDVLGRIRRRDRVSVVSESWHCQKGSETGFRAGKDDTTAISILKPDRSKEDQDFKALVGRANGDLRLISVGDSDFGRTLMHFSPLASSSIRQNEIQTIDIESDSKTLIAGTKENVLLYSITNQDTGHPETVIGTPSIDPVTAISLKDRQQSPAFDFIRSIKSLNKTTIAVALNRSFDPIQVLSVTPTGLDVSRASRISGEYHRIISSDPRTVRSILPVDTRSIASGGQNVVLSSWDDGTIRLQDLRTPSPVDRIYQDNFEVGTPINALVSYGLERFVAGSAYSHMLKIFDYRWPKGYYHTDSLPCTNASPYPKPTPPTKVPEPQHHDDRTRCDHLTGRLCRWHALSHHDFYRPNCNIYMPFHNYATSPTYTLAKPSDVSPTIYAGLSGLLVEATLKSGASPTPIPDTNPLYVQERGKVAILETGDGYAIDDMSKCYRVPEIRRQSFSSNGRDISISKWRHRLDEDLQDPKEWEDIRDLAA